MGVLGSIFGFGDTLKRRLKDAASNPRDFTEMAVDQNQNEWRKNPDERSMGFFNPVPLGTMGKFVVDSQAQKIVDQLSRNHALKPKSSSLPQEAIDQALRDYPEVPKELLTKYMNQAYKTGIAEKTSNPDTWTQLQRTMHDAGDWKGFSKSRGYTEKEIADFDEMISLHGQLSKYLPERKMPNGEVWDDLGSIDAFLINPHIDAAKEAAAANPIQSESRRSFMKKSAGIAGGTAAMSIPGAKLLQKFAPEERAVAKQAAVKQGVAEAAPKYKYNSLKDYLDDVHEGVTSSAGPRGWQTTEGGFGTYDDLIKKRLHEDEAGYEASKFFYKDNLKDPKTGKWIDPFSGQPHGDEFLRNIPNTKDHFSPQAKKEMKDFKNNYREEFDMGNGVLPGGSDGWVDILMQSGPFK